MKAQLQGKIEPIKKKFEFIMDDNYSDIGTGTFELTEKDKSDLAGIDQAWKTFLLGMNEAKDVLRKCQTDFKAGMEEKIEEFKKDIQDIERKFDQTAPLVMTKDFELENNKKAFDNIQYFNTECKQLRDREEDMQFGLEIFNIEATKYLELAKVEKHNASLYNIWTIKQEWDNEWNDWKEINFQDLDFRMMEERASDILFKVNSLSKEEKKWKVSEVIYDRIYTFLNTLPLITSLRDESMRDRHWKELRIEVKEDFDEKSEDFTLEKVFSLNLLAHQEKIEEICSHARQQLKIEKSLDQISYMWEESQSTNLEIEVSLTKSKQEPCYKISTTENIITLIEEHSGELAKHKSSPFYKQFDDKIDMWENNIARITETLEILMVVQERWQYLESIFGGQLHIQKQLAQEYAIFTTVDITFRAEMFRIHQIKNAYKSLVDDSKDFISKLNHLNLQLEVVQKKLNDLLAAKRAMFPRFFFLSNDDLLEIIGQAKNPVAINKHIKKIYEGIYKIHCEPMQASKGQKEYVITYVEAEDGE